MPRQVPVLETHGKPHALRRQAAEVRGELMLLLTEQAALNSKVQSLEWKASEVDHALGDVEAASASL